MSGVAYSMPVPLHFTSVSRTHVGNVRRLNEDRLLDRPEVGLWAIADGMGGHSKGDVAATMVIDALAKVQPGVSGYAALTDASSALAAANAALCRHNNGTRTLASGSTIVVLLACEGHYACLWAGDSRAYLFRDNVLTRLTRDHSVVQELIDGDLLAEDERYHHPRANVITRAFGQAPALEIDRSFGPILPDDAFLLCSDGLTGCLSERELADSIGEEGSQAADALLNVALSRGAPDNISLVLIRADVSRPTPGGQQ